MNGQNSGSVRHLISTSDHSLTPELTEFGPGIVRLGGALEARMTRNVLNIGSDGSDNESSTSSSKSLRHLTHLEHASGAERALKLLVEQRRVTPLRPLQRGHLTLVEAASARKRAQDTEAKGIG